MAEYVDKDQAHAIQLYLGFRVSGLGFWALDGL